jgi:hypothetical protein
MGLAWSKDPERHPGGSTATNGGQVEGDDTDKRYTLVLQVGGFGVRLTTLSCKKFDIEKNSEMPRR